MITLYSPMTGGAVADGRGVCERGAERGESAGDGEPVECGVVVGRWWWGMWGISPFIEKFAVQALVALGAVHLLASMALVWFSSEPARGTAIVHPQTCHKCGYPLPLSSGSCVTCPECGLQHDLTVPHPPVFTRLLVTFRLLLPMSYVVSERIAWAFTCPPCDDAVGV